MMPGHTVTERELRARLDQFDHEAERNDARIADLQLRQAAIKDARAETEAALANLPKEEQRKATTPTLDPVRVVSESQQLGQFTLPELAARLQVNVRVVKASVLDLIEKGEMRDTGVKFRGQSMYEAASAYSIEVRDWITRQTEPFGLMAAVEALELDDSTIVTETLDVMVAKGSVKYVGLEGMDLWEYAKPTDAGRASMIDQQRRALDSATVGNGGADPVAGTGKGLKIKDQGVRELVASVQRQGAVVDHAPNGHFAVVFQGHRCLISSTPSNSRSVHNDRARLRRIGLEV